MTQTNEHEFLAADGTPYRTGLMLPEPNQLPAASAYESSAFPILDEADIRKLITRERKPRRLIFDDHWVIEGNQKQKSSCNGWAGSAVQSKTRWLRGIQDGAVLSGSYVYSWINNNQDNGSALDRGMAELMSHGAPLASRCNADMIYRKQTQQFDTEAMAHLGLGCYAAKTKQGFRSGLALGFLGVVCLHVAGNFVNFKGENSIVSAYNGVGNHAIHCDDILLLNGTEVYDTVNNWGVNWGFHGRGYTVWDNFAQPFNIHTFYLITSTEEQDAPGIIDRVLAV